MLLKEDVVSVATGISISLTEEEIQEVLEMYPEAQENDPSGTWDLVIENCIHNVVSDRPIKKQRKIQEAREFLKSEGFQTDNLWTAEDVQHKWNCSQEDAIGILYSALTNDATMEQIWMAIDFHAEDSGLELKERHTSRW
jgi:hypothetical protein